MKGPSSLFEWRKGTVTAFRCSIEHYIRIRDDAQRKIDGMLAVNKALNSIKMKRDKTEDQPDELVKSKRKVGGAAVKGAVHWSKRPGVDPKKLAAWRKKLAKNLRNGRKK